MKKLRDEVKILTYLCHLYRYPLQCKVQQNNCQVQEGSTQPCYGLGNCWGLTGASSTFGLILPPHPQLKLFGPNSTVLNLTTETPTTTAEATRRASAQTKQGAADMALTQGTGGRCWGVWFSSQPQEGFEHACATSTGAKAWRKKIYSVLKWSAESLEQNTKCHCPSREQKHWCAAAARGMSTRLGAAPRTATLVR